MISLSTAARIEAHKMHGDGVWLVLLEIKFPGIVEPIYLCRNTEDIVWDSKTWIAFPFEISDIKETTNGEIPSVTLKVSNISRVVQSYLEDLGNGGVGGIFTVRVVHSDHLDAVTPEIEEEFCCTSTKADEQWVSFELGTGDPVLKRLPMGRYLKNFCRFKFGGIECGCTGIQVGLRPDGTMLAGNCRKTLDDCRLHLNSPRFGGFVSIPRGGMYV